MSAVEVGVQEFRENYDGIELEENDQADNPDLVDVSIEREVSTNNSKKTVLGYFNDFLIYQNSKLPNDYPITSYELLPTEQVTKTLIGTFADWIFSVKKANCVGTACGYLGVAKTYFDLKYPDNLMTISKDWYAGLRRRLKRRYKLQCIEVYIFLIIYLITLTKLN
jgi:hypothetical protein